MCIPPARYIPCTTEADGYLLNWDLRSYRQHYMNANTSSRLTMWTVVVHPDDTIFITCHQGHLILCEEEVDSINRAMFDVFSKQHEFVWILLPTSFQVRLNPGIESDCTHLERHKRYALHGITNEE